MRIPIAVACTALAIAACDTGSNQSSEDAATAPPLASGEDVTLSHMRREHELEGRLIAIDPDAGEVLIEHEPVPSLELTSDRTQFLLADATDADNLQAGDPVHFVLVRDNYGRYVIREIWRP